MTEPKPRTLLFVCTGNTCRSPMAERLAARRCADISGWSFASAGVFAANGAPPSDLAVAALRESGIALDDHRARPLSGDMVRTADLVVTMTQGHRDMVLDMVPEAVEKVHTLHSFGLEGKGNDVMDPFGGGMDTYRLVRDEIDAALPDLILAAIRPGPSPTPNPEETDA